MNSFTYVSLPSRVVFGAGAVAQLADLGFREADLAKAARIATEAPYPNPAPVAYDGVLALLRRAHAGLRPL